MRIRRISGLPNAVVLAEAQKCIADGGTLIFPTDTVYGIGCAPENDRAVAAIFDAKRRPLTKPLALHLTAREEAQTFAARLTRGARAVMDLFWPGPVTIIVERNRALCAAAARNGPTIALRLPDAPACTAILRATGPLAATSANVSGAPAYAGDEGEIDALPDATLAIIAGPTKQRRESTVLDCSTDTVRVVRSGAVDPAKIAAALEGVAAFERQAQ